MEHRLHWISFASLSIIILLGVTRGVITPSALQAHARLRSKEVEANQLFHSAKLGTNGLSCDSCHEDGGRFPHQIGNRWLPSLIHAKSEFPRVTQDGHIVSLEQQINDCIVHALDGRPRPANSQTLNLLDLYVRHLSRFHER